MEFEIGDLRKLRTSAKELSNVIMEDLAPYVHRLDKQTFVRLPDSRHDVDDVGVTVTCSCLMGLALTGNLKEFQKQISCEDWNAKACFKLVVETPIWRSSGLLKMNAFTSTLVLRAFGFLVEKGELESSDAKKMVHKGEQQIRDHKREAVTPPSSKQEWTLLDVLSYFSAEAPKRLAVENYPTSAAVVYWFLDAVQRSRLNQVFDKDAWNGIASWAATEFWKQESLVVAENDALMDPVAMGMSACICKKLKNLAEANKKGSNAEYLHLLPSEAELDFALKLLFSKQAGSGIWPKYFPLFHYPDAGNNFCFTFELLEAILNEFGKGDDIRIFELEGAFKCLSKALEWCRRNRFEFQNGSQTYRGWNSGGQLLSLTGGKPESWATAVVHMFLWELEDVLSRKIEQNLLVDYKAIKYKHDPSALCEFADIEILINKQPTLLKALLKDHLIDPAQKDEPDIRRKGLNENVSALLFGPPGTSKTEMCTAVAKQLGWPLLQIDPSHFLEGGLEAISVRADKIFTDLLDLNGVVVLFDEMDPLVQTRDDEEDRLDITSQLLTTSMLPKLTKLHDQRRVIFFMATNFQNRFDPAIKRAGRFDLLLCMGPPCLESKLRDLRLFLKKGTSTEEVEKSFQLLKKYATEDPELAQTLELFLYGEFKSFLKELQKAELLSKKLEACKAEGFKMAVAAAAEFNFLRLKDLNSLMVKLNRKTIKELETDTNMNYDYCKENGVRLHPIVRYLADKGQSKLQA